MLRFALTAPLSDLVDESVAVTGTLVGELGLINDADLSALEGWGLPMSPGIDLYPSIGPTVNTSDYLIADSYALGMLQGSRLFVRPAHGRVLKVTAVDGIQYRFVNSSVRQLVELAWRFHHLEPLLTSASAAATVWRWARRFDPLIDFDSSLSFWESTIKGLAMTPP